MYMSMCKRHNLKNLFFSPSNSDFSLRKLFQFFSIFTWTDLLPSKRKDVTDLPGGIEPELIALFKFFYKSWFIVYKMQSLFQRVTWFLNSMRIILAQSRTSLEICLFNFSDKSSFIIFLPSFIDNFMEAVKNCCEEVAKSFLVLILRFQFAFNPI